VKLAKQERLEQLAQLDKLEQLVDDTKWPLPKFRELLFIK
jgi:glutamine synthetase type III